MLRLLRIALAHIRCEIYLLRTFPNVERKLVAYDLRGRTLLIGTTTGTMIGWCVGDDVRLGRVFYNPCNLAL